MFFKFSPFLFMLIILSGCAANMADYPEMQLNDEHHLKSASFSFDIPQPTVKPLLQCVKENVNHEKVHLQDQHNAAWVGYSGLSIFVPTSHTTLKKRDTILSESYNEVLAYNLTQYTGSINGKKSLRYKLLVTTKEKTASYLFTNIERAMEKTGFSSNKGFFYIGDWTPDFDKAYTEMKKTAQNIYQCLMGK